MTDNLQKYIKKFQKLRQGVTKYGPAPHKPVLLLSVIQAFETGLLQSRQTELTPELVGIFKTIWGQLVTTKHQALIAQPFFHMRSEGFWKLIPNPSCEQWLKSTRQLKSITQLRMAVAHAEIDQEPAALLLDDVNRELLKQTILDTYFPDTKGAFQYDRDEPELFGDLGNKMISEAPAEYKAKLDELRAKMEQEEFEEEVFIRSGVFKTEVLKIYNHTCSISGLHVETLSNASLVDACHIVSFAESHDDTISNGFCLSPTLHRAFDRGLIGIDERYRVIVAKHLSEITESPYSIRQFEGKSICLPDKRTLQPGRVNFMLHRERWGLGA